MASYIDEVLIAGEKVLGHGHISLWALSPYIVFGVLLTPIVVGLFLLGYAFIIYKTTEIAITNKRIITKFGFISRETSEMNLQRIEGIMVKQSVLGRLFDFGDLYFSGTGHQQAPVRHISQPILFRKVFMEAQDEILKTRPLILAG